MNKISYLFARKCESLPDGADQSLDSSSASLFEELMTFLDLTYHSRANCMACLKAAYPPGCLFQAKALVANAPCNPCTAAAFSMSACVIVASSSSSAVGVPQFSPLSKSAFVKTRMIGLFGVGDDDLIYSTQYPMFKSESKLSHATHRMNAIASSLNLSGWPMNSVSNL